MLSYRPYSDGVRIKKPAFRTMVIEVFNRCSLVDFAVSVVAVLGSVSGTGSASESIRSIVQIP